MSSFKTARTILFATTALGFAGVAGAAFAQAPANNNAIEEVVVTATRQTSTVNKVALSVSAVTQKSLEKQGVQNVDDLSRQVPGFTFRKSGGDNNPQLTIRGVGGNSLASTSGGAATTGVYLDDIPLMQRNLNGLQTGNGSVTPVLYDLERVEVLRGPQGTLYGGSSEGGTIRFLTPTPSLTRYSGQVRLGGYAVENGGWGNEEGIAIGGPIVQDKLGFRISGYRTDRPGWIDEKSMYDGHTFATDVNSGQDMSLNAKLLWQITPDFKATLGFFGQQNYDRDGANFRLATGPQVINGGTFNNGQLDGNGRLVLANGTNPATNRNPLTINGVPFAFQNVPYPTYTVGAMPWYNTQTNSIGRYLSPTNVRYDASPRRSIASIPTLTLDYNWNDKVNFKSISAWESNRTSGNTLATAGNQVRTQIIPNAVSGGVTPEYLMTSINPATGKVDGGTYNLSDTYGYYFYNNRHNSYSEELRASSIDPSSRLQFVAGFFFQKQFLRDTVGSNYNEVPVSLALRGVPEQFFLGAVPAPFMQVPGQAAVDVSTRNISVDETEYSAFADVTYAVTDKLKITAGFRYTDYTQRFNQVYGGAVAGAPTGFVGTSSNGPGTTETNPFSTTPFPTNYAACPTTVASAGCPYQYTSNTLKEHPVTPKAGISYQLTPNDLLYFTYAQGFRPGGVNPAVPTLQCSIDLAALGVTDTPLIYKHDTVDSFEGGAKMRLFGGAAQVNASAFRINWNNVQFTNVLRQCNFSYITNAAQASSTGFEIQGTGRVGPFTLNGNVAYDKAVYEKELRTQAGALVVKKGDNLGVPDWTVNAGAQYDGAVMGLASYARLDYMYTGKYMRTTGFGTTGYNAAYVNGNETHTMNARAGVYVKDTEVAFYVKNLTNSQEFINLTQTVNSPVFNGSTFQPRTYGVQINYRW